MRKDKEHYLRALALARLLAQEALEGASDMSADAFHAVMDSVQVMNRLIGERAVKPWEDYGDDGSRPEARFRELTKEELKKMEPYPFPRLYHELTSALEHVLMLNGEMKKARNRCPELSQQLSLLVKRKEEGDEVVRVGTNLVNISIPIDEVMDAVKIEYEGCAETAGRHLKQLREALLESVDTIDFMLAAKRVGIPDIANPELEL